MPADLNDYFKKRGGGNSGGGGDNNNGGGNNFNFKIPQLDGKKAITLYVAIAVILLLIVARPFKIINSGEVGIRVTTGVYSPIPLDPGLHFFLPFIQDIIPVDAKVRMMSYTSTEQMGRIGETQQKLISSGDSYISASSVISQESISVKDARGLDFHIDLAVLYHLNALQAPNTMSIWGLNWENKIIDPTVREVVREVAGRYNAEDIPQKRSEFAEAIKEDIIKSIEAQEGKPVVLNTVQLREIILPEKIRQQIEQVQLARQQVEEARNQVSREKQEAEKKVATAKGEADAIKTMAQGKADAIKMEADANAYANLQISKSLTPSLLQLRQIETQAKFNEALKENRDAQIFLTPGGAVPNIWVDTKDKQKQSSIGQ
ncbi:MAG: prohibitin family protein [Campylobacteraceae bacterium]|jgi:regulator of protease activity HflC (stomatin/prohibitin superfamily)|nr:prohibitin family protein [Campylobacteraceae bacterium]